MRRSEAFLACLAVGALACGGTATPPTVTPPAPAAGEAVADNGIRREPLGQADLLVQPSASPVIDIRVVFDAGSAEDPAGLAGATNLAARLMVEGGAGELTYEALMRRLYPMAAKLGSHTGRDQTVFVGRVHRDHLEAFYGVFRDILRAPRMGEADFERVRAQIRSALELELRGNDDEELGKQALQSLLYRGHPYAHPPLGTIEGLGALDVEAVRRQRRRVFCGGRATVGVAGALPGGFASRVRDDVAELVFEECVGRRVLPEPEADNGPRVLLVDKDEATAVAVSMGMPIDLARGHEDYAAIMFATAYLGQHRQFVGRLMQTMRGERGMNYGDYAYAEHFDQEGWSRFPLANIARRQQYFSIWIRPVKLEQAHFAVRIAVRELHRFVEEGLSAEDFERVRSFADRYYALYLQTGSRRLGYAVDDRFYGLGRPWLEELRARWRELTVEDVNAAIKRHIDPSKLRMAIVHPDGEAFADALASDAPSPIEYITEPSAQVLAEDREIVAYPLHLDRNDMAVVPVNQMFVGR